MMNKDATPMQVIDDFLNALRDTAAESPSLRARLVEVLGVNVIYEGEEQFEGANPAVQASRWSQDAFERIWSAAKVGEIKTVIKDHQLATNMDMKGLKKKELVELLYIRASSKAEELGLS